MNEYSSVSFCHTLVTYFQWLRHYCRVSAQMKRGKWYCVYKPHQAVNVRGFINPIWCLGVNCTYPIFVLFFSLHFFFFSQGMQIRERAHCAYSVFPFIKKKKLPVSCLSWPVCHESFLTLVCSLLLFSKRISFLPVLKPCLVLFLCFLLTNWCLPFTPCLKPCLHFLPQFLDP